MVSRRDGSLPVGAPHPLGLYRDDCRFLSGHELCVNRVRPRLLVASAARGLGVRPRADQPGAAPAGRADPAAAEPAAAPRAADRRRRRGRGDAARSTPTTASRSTSTSTCCWPPTSSRCWRSAASWPRARASRSPSSGATDGLRFAQRGRDGLHRATHRHRRPPGRAGRRASASCASRSACRRAAPRRSRCATACTRTRPRRAGARRRDRSRRRAARADDVARRAHGRGDRRRALQPRAAALAARHPDAALAPRRRRLLRGRRAVVRDALRPRLADHGDAAARLRPDDGRADAARARGADRHARRPRARRGAGQGPPRAARRRGRAAASSPRSPATTARSTRRRCSSACCASHGLERRPGAVPRAARRGRGDARLDRRPGRPRRRRAARVPAARAAPACATRAGRTPTRACSTSTARRSSRRSRSSSRRPTRYRAKRRLARLFALDGDAARGGAAAARGGRAARAARALLAARPRATTRWAGAATRGRAGRSPPTRATCCGGSPCTPERAAAIRDSLMSDAMFSGWGIRTLAEGEAGYNPVGYHLGTVWPHDTAMIAFGLRKYGFDEDFDLVFEALLEAAANAEAYRLPELYAGFGRTEFETPVPYPVACQPQAWAAGAIPYLVAGALGLVPDALERRLRIRRPVAAALALARRGPRPADRRRHGRPAVRAHGRGRPGRARRRAHRGRRGGRARDHGQPRAGGPARRGRPSPARAPSARRRSRPARGWRPATGRSRPGAVDGVELRREPERVERRQHARADPLGRLGPARGPQPAPAEPAVERPDAAAVVGVAGGTPGARRRACAARARVSTSGRGEPLGRGRRGRPARARPPTAASRAASRPRAPAVPSPSSAIDLRRPRRRAARGARPRGSSQPPPASSRASASSAATATAWESASASGGSGAEPSLADDPRAVRVALDGRDRVAPALLREPAGAGARAVADEAAAGVERAREPAAGRAPAPARARARAPRRRARSSTTRNQLVASALP